MNSGLFFVFCFFLFFVFVFVQFGQVIPKKKKVPTTPFLKKKDKIPITQH